VAARTDNTHQTSSGEMWEQSDAPQETVPDLPSKFRSYPQGATISFRGYTYRELKKFNSSTLTLFDRLRFMLAGMEASFGANNLTLGDFFYLGFMRKFRTLGDQTIVAQVTCPNEKCATTNKIPIHSRNFDFIDLEAPKLPVVVDFPQGAIEFRPLTIGQYLDMVAASNVGDDTAAMAMQMSLAYEEAVKLIESCQGEDLRILYQIDELFTHGLKPVQTQCVECGRRMSVHLDKIDTLILPFRESKGSARARIRFGV